MRERCLVAGEYPASSRYCSLPVGHEGPHVAYLRHKVTGNGRDVFWLGPWSDDRPWEGEQADRLSDEWMQRHD